MAAVRSTPSLMAASRVSPSPRHSRFSPDKGTEHQGGIDDSWLTKLPQEGEVKAIVACASHYAWVVSNKVVLYDVHSQTQRELHSKIEDQALAFTPDGRALAYATGSTVQLKNLDAKPHT